MKHAATMKAIAALIAIAVVTAGCGGDGGGNEAAKEPTPSATPTPVETDECRSAVSSVESVAASLDAQVENDPDQLNQLATKVKTIRNQAATNCGAAVTVPLDKAVDRMARAAARSEACQVLALCSTRPIAKALVVSATALRDAATQADRVEG